MKGLSRESRALIDAARDGDNPSADDRKRVRAALARKIAVGVAAGAVAMTATHAAPAGQAAAGVAAGTSAAASTVATGVAAGGATAGAGTSIAAGAVATGFGAKLLVSVAIVGAVGAGTVSYSRHEAGKRAAAETQATSVAGDRARGARPAAKSADRGAFGKPNAAAPAITDAPAVVAAERIPGVAEPVAVNAAPPAAWPVAAPPAASPGAASPGVASANPAAAPPSLTPDLDAELALLQEAHAALRGNEGARALRLLQEHARRFPNGQLGEESEAARVFALCELGRVDEARDVAGRFLREHPRSPLAPRVSRACDAEPSTF